MINKETYKRLTKTDEGGKSIIRCGKKCPNYENCTSSIFDCNKFIIDRLAELEDKIMDGTLIDLPCKVGDTATALIDTLAYDNSIQKVKIKGIAYIVEDENGDITFQHTSRVFFNKNEAEAKLKELQENKK